MRTNKAVRRSLWRWRRSPLRRREDLLEGWVLLITWLVIAVGAPLAGALSAQATVDSLAQRRAERHAATATLVGDAPHSALSAGTTDNRVFAAVRWAASDSTRHTGKALVDAGLKAGERVVVWTDRQDRITAEPQSPAQAEVQGAFTGAAASLSLAAAAAAGFYGVRVVLDRRRMRAWDAEWQQAGSQWGRAAS